MMPADPTSTDPAAPDPSMDDILASIRRILDEEGAKPALDSDQKKPEVMELDPSMMLPESDAAPASKPEPARTDAARVETTRVGPVRMEATRVQVSAANQKPSAPPPAPPPAPAPQPAANEAAPTAMVAPEAAAAAASSIGSLLRTLASERNAATHRGGLTIEDIVREELRPMLKEWLDNHLAPVVERLVRAEIERVVGRMT